MTRFFSTISCDDVSFLRLFCLINAYVYSTLSCSIVLQLPLYLLELELLDAINTLRSVTSTNNAQLRAAMLPLAARTIASERWRGSSKCRELGPQTLESAALSKVVPQATPARGLGDIFLNLDPSETAKEISVLAVVKMQRARVDVTHTAVLLPS